VGSRDLFKLWKIADNMLEMVQDSDTVTVEDQQEIICGISNGINSNDLE